MIQDLEQDLLVSHSVINYLHAGYQGAFTQHSILSRLSSQKVNPQGVKNCTDRLGKIAKWSADLNKGLCLVSAAWEKPQTFEAAEAYTYLGELRSELLNIAQEVAGLLGTTSLTLESEEAKLMAATFGRFAYAREHYLRGFVELGKASGKQELVDQYSKYAASASEDVALTHRFLDGFKVPSNEQTANMLSNLRYLCMRLPGAFRAQAHDVAQLNARFSGGMTFEAAGIPVSRATMWKDLNVTPVEAGYWEAHFIGPDEAVAWSKAGIAAHEAAANWRIHGFHPIKAEAWAKQGFSPQVALAWAANGFEAAQALEFIKSGVTDPRDAKQKKPGPTENT